MSMYVLVTPLVSVPVIFLGSRASVFIHSPLLILLMYVRRSCSERDRQPKICHACLARTHFSVLDTIHERVERVAVTDVWTEYYQMSTYTVASVGWKGTDPPKQGICQGSGAVSPTQTATTNTN